MDSIRNDVAINTGFKAGNSIKTNKSKGTTINAQSDSFTPGEANELKQVDMSLMSRARAGSDSGLSLSAAGVANPGVRATIAAATGPVVASVFGSLAKLLVDDKTEEMIGQALAKQVESSMPISVDPVLNARVKNIGSQIAAKSSRPGLNWTFKVIDDPTINAFAGPGGKVYVHRGLLEKFPKDSHLAFIIGHEVGHVEHKDSLDRIGLQFAFGIAAAVLGKTPGKLDDMLGLAIGKLYDGQVSQKAEYNADRAGVKHMHDLGFDPEKSGEALRGLLSAGQKEPGLLEKLFASHPPTLKRAEKAEAYGRKLKKS